jgi:hypothetical protein
LIFDRLFAGYFGSLRFLGGADAADLLEVLQLTHGLEVGALETGLQGGDLAKNGQLKAAI